MAKMTDETDKIDQSVHEILLVPAPSQSPICPGQQKVPNIGNKPQFWSFRSSGLAELSPLFASMPCFARSSEERGNLACPAPARRTETKRQSEKHR
jgi:hypothetical protein